MPLILGAQSATAGGYSIDNSCRFNGADSTELHYTQGTPTDNNTWTFSCWFKRASTTTERALFGTTPGGNITKCRIMAGATVQFLDNQSGDTGKLTTNRLLRDSTAWMHMVCVWDSDNGAAGDRVRMYINGTEETSFSTDTQPSSGQATIWNTASQVANVGRDNDGNYWDGYMADVVFIDGTAYAASDFGEFNEDSPTIWQPKDPSGLTFGNNGFWLDFKDSADLGNDVSGVGNDLTVTNLDATDQATDTPTNNFCVLNPLDNYLARATFSEGNCVLVTATGAATYNTSTHWLTKGKWYVEVEVTTGIGDEMFGLAGQPSILSTACLGCNFWGFAFQSSTGNFYTNSGGTSYGSAWAVDGKVVGGYFDLDNNLVYWAIDGVIQNSGTGKAITAASTVTIPFNAFSVGFSDGGAASGTYSFNYGGCPAFAITSAQEDANGYGKFEYSPNDGGSASFDGSAKDFLAICTKNLGSDGG